MSYTHLSKFERECIHRWRIEKIKVPEMALRLARSRSTIYRELKRNAVSVRSYEGVRAHTLYRKRIRWHRERPKRGDKQLMNMVKKRLQKKWAPQQIAEAFRRITYRSKPSRWVSTSTIYRFIEEAKEQSGQLHTHLRRFGKHRPKRYKAGADGRGRIVDRVGIEHRPSIVDAQLRVGDFEGDTIHGSNRKGGLATFVDRLTLYTLAFWIPDRSTASLIGAARECFKHIPHTMRHTMTVDNGPEFRNHKELSKAIKMDVFFAHPYASWERPINENTNGLLRQYFPKKQPLNIITQEQVQYAVNELNHRPRKKLNYRTPHQVFWQMCRT